LARQYAPAGSPAFRDRRRKQAAATTGITVEPRARFAYSAPIGTTDDGRTRRITSSTHGRASATSRVHEVIAEGIQETYFFYHG
jgi:hypothetical protein